MTTQVPQQLISGLGSAALLTAGTGANNVLQLDGSGLVPGATMGASSLASNGYQKLPGGLIIQWGSISVTASSQVSVTFPIAFTTACYTVVVNYVDTPNGGASMPGVGCGCGSITTSGCSIGNGSGTTHTVGWMALGK